MDFVIETPRNQGVSPQNIMATINMYRSISAKMAAGVDGVFCRLQCRGELDNASASISFSSI